MRLSTVLVAWMAVAGTATAAPGDWTVQRSQFDAGDIARYKALLAKDPHDPILVRLVALYRSYRSIDQLVHEYEGEGGWAGFVVLGRLHRTAGRTDQALEAWT